MLSELHLPRSRCWSQQPGWICWQLNRFVIRILVYIALLFWCSDNLRLFFLSCCFKTTWFSFQVVVPLAAVFGIAVWVYQFGALNWLPGGPGNNPFTSPPGGGFYWAAPVFTCTIIIGLALDYDVFLFARVVELRKKGYSTLSHIVQEGDRTSWPTKNPLKTHMFRKKHDPFMVFSYVSHSHTTTNCWWSTR